MSESQLSCRKATTIARRPGSLHPRNLDPKRDALANVNDESSHAVLTATSGANDGTTIRCLFSSVVKKWLPFMPIGSKMSRFNKSA